MKKKFFYLFLLIFILLVSLSCRKEESSQVGPTLQLKTDSGYIHSDTSLSIGSSIRIGIIASKGDENITNLIIRVTSNNAQNIYLDSGLNSANLNFDRTYIKTVYERETWEITVRDRLGKSASVSFIITKDSSSSFQNIIYHPQVILGAQKNTSIGSFFDIYDSLIYNQNTAFQHQSNIDLLYYYDFAGDANTVASPGANVDTSIFNGSTGLAYWTQRNETRFIKTLLSAAIFDNIKDDSLLIATYVEGQGKRKAKNLVAGDIYSFKTAASKFGLFKVLSVIGTDQGTAEISIKIQR